jgi:rod shape-determining protein MreD
VTTLAALVALVAALALQTGLGGIWPDVHRYVDLPLVVVVWYAIARSQRSAMLLGCAAGLLQDAWFRIAVFGMNGFKKTLLGWALGGIASRFDLNQPGGRLVAGTLVGLGDRLLEWPLRRLLDQHVVLPGLLDLAGPALTTGLLVLFAGNIVERAGGRVARHPI